MGLGGLLGDVLGVVEDAAEDVEEVVDGVAGAGTPAIPLYAHTVAGAEERYWILPVGVEAGLDANGDGAVDVTVRVDPVPSGTDVIGVDLRIERKTNVAASVALGLRTDGQVVTDDASGDWAYARFARDGMPVPDRLDLHLESTGDLDTVGNTQTTRVQLGVTGNGVAPDLPTGLRLTALTGAGTGALRVPGRVPVISVLNLNLVASDIFVADVDELSGIAARFAGADVPLVPSLPQVDIEFAQTIDDVIGSGSTADRVVSTRLHALTAQRLDVDVETVDPNAASTLIELRRLATDVAFRDEPHLVPVGGQPQRDGTVIKVEVDRRTDSATLRLPTATGGVAATIRELDTFSLRLRTDVGPLLVAMPVDAATGDTLTQALGAVILQARSAHPVGPVGQPLELPKQAVVLDTRGSLLDAGLVAPRRVSIQERVDAVHSRAGGPTNDQDWLIGLQLGHLEEVNDTKLTPEGMRPLRVCVEAENSRVLARAADLPDDLGLDLHVGGGGGLGLRLTGAMTGLRANATLPPPDGRTAQPQVNATVPTTATGGFDLVVVDGLPVISSTETATAFVGAHSLGVDGSEGSLAIDSVDVLTRIPPTEIEAGSGVTQASVRVAHRTGDDGVSVECSAPTGSRIAITSPDVDRIALRPTPQIALGLPVGPTTVVTPASAPPTRISARVLGLISVKVGGDPPDNIPLSLPTAEVRLAQDRVNRSMRVHTFEGTRQDMRVRIADVPDELDIAMRSVAPIGIGGAAPAAPLRPATRLDLRASAPSGEVVIAGRPTARTYFGPSPGTRVGTGWVSGRIESIPRKLTVLGLSDPALLVDPSDDSETAPELWQSMPDRFMRDGLHIAVSDPLTICRLASIAPDRAHPSDGTVMWAYTYIHGLRVAPAGPVDADVTFADLPAFTLWNPTVVPTDQDSFDEPEAAGSFRVTNDARVDLWLGKSEKSGGPGEVDVVDLLPASSFAVESELMFTDWGGHIAISEEFGLDPRHEDNVNGPGHWWIRSVGKLPLLGWDVTLADDSAGVIFDIFVFGERPDFSDPCGG